jgi:hypothetical protein
VKYLKTRHRHVPTTSQVRAQQGYRVQYGRFQT